MDREAKRKAKFAPKEIYMNAVCREVQRSRSQCSLRGAEFPEIEVDTPF